MHEGHIYACSPVICLVSTAKCKHTKMTTINTEDNTLNNLYNLTEKRERLCKRRQMITQTFSFHI